MALDSAHRDRVRTPLSDKLAFFASLLVAQALIPWANAHPVQYPLGEGELFTGIVDVVEGTALIFEDELGSKFSVTDVPDSLKEVVAKLRHNLVDECPVCNSQHVTDHCTHCD